MADIIDTALKSPMQLPTQRITGCRRLTTSSESMMSKHLCPCCSDVLLRHMRLGYLYWRCSCCNQEMPI